MSTSVISFYSRHAATSSNRASRLEQDGERYAPAENLLIKDDERVDRVAAARGRQHDLRPPTLMHRFETRLTAPI